MKLNQEESQSLVVLDVHDKWQNVQNFTFNLHNHLVIGWESKPFCFYVRIGLVKRLRNELGIVFVSSHLLVVIVYLLFVIEIERAIKQVNQRIDDTDEIFLKFV
jgi:hypothetical protein